MASHVSAVSYHGQSRVKSEDVLWSAPYVTHPGPKAFLTSFLRPWREAGDITTKPTAQILQHHYNHPLFVHTEVNMAA